MMNSAMPAYVLRSGAGPLGPNDNCTTNTCEPVYQDLATIEMVPDTNVRYVDPDP
jgi:hypothetical protein